MLSRRGTLAATVLVGWGTGLGLLIARELNPAPGARLAEVALRIVPTTTYYRVERDGEQVGFASIEIDTVPRTLRVTEYLVADADSGPGSRVTERSVASLSRGLMLRGFEQLRVAGADSQRVAGQVADSLLVVERGGGNGMTSDTMAISLPAFPGAIAGTVTVLMGEPRVGTEESFTGIDPARGLPQPASLRLVAESLFVVVDSAVADSSGRWFAVHRDTVRAWKLTSGQGQPRVDAWVDAQGLVVEATRPDGLTLRRTAFELAFENWRQANPSRAVSARADGRIMPVSWVASGAPRPAAYIDTLRVRIAGDVTREVGALLGSRVRPGTIRAVTPIPASQLRSRYSLPTTERWQKVFKESLAPTSLLELDHPVISRRAIRLRGTETDPLAVVHDIVAWVHDSLRAIPSASTQPASRALERMEGDAREFALVTAALARAAGVPARLVSGLLYHDGRFFAHAWTLVNIGRWIPVDAMLGQVPADAAHIEFLWDSADSGPELARVLGRLDLDVVGISPAPGVSQSRR